MEQVVDIRELLSACCHLAEEAGAIATEVINTGDLQINQKDGPEDLVTIADLRIQSAIIGALLKKWPGLHIVGEESVQPDVGDSVITVHTDRVERYLEAKSHKLDKVTYPLQDISVYVDPLDGTKEFTRGIYSHVTVLIGIAVGSEPIAGVVYQPWHCEGPDVALRPQLLANSTKRMFWGLVGYGIAGLEEKQRETRPLDNLIATDSHSTPSPHLPKLKPKKVISQGGCGSKCVLVLSGEADVYIIGTKTKKWDTCAPHALLRSVGGFITDLEGNSLQYHKGVEVVNPACLVGVSSKDELINILKQ